MVLISYNNKKILRHALITVVMKSIYERKPSLSINAVNEHLVAACRRDAP